MDEKKILINNLEINYKTAGEGKSLLVLHGWGGSSDTWIEVQEILSKQGYKTICPDLPGFGKSQIPAYAWDLDDYCDFIESFILSLNLEKFYLLGHSFGGALAVKCGLKFPQKIEKLFLIDAACFRRAKLKKRIFFIIAKILKIFSFLPFYSQAKKAFYKFMVGRSDYPYAEGIMKDIYLKIIKEDLGDDLGKIKMLTVIIWGEKDRTTPLKQAYLVKEKIYQAKLEIIPDVGHSPHRDTPEILAEKILENLNH